MLGLGTIINCAGILLGGFFGLFAGRCGHPERQEALQKACGIAVLFIGISGAMAGMLQVGGSALSSGKAMLVALSLALGTVLGELLSLEAWFARLGKWLRDKTGSSGDPRFIDAFVTASLTVCIGAMSIVGAIQDGVSRDYSTLAVKAVLDCVIIAVMTASLGKGCIFSAIPVFVLEGAVTLLTPAAGPGPDGAGGLVSLADRLDFDLLRGGQSHLGQAAAGRQYAPGHPLCHRVFLSPLVLLIRGHTPAKQKIWRTVAVHQIFCFDPFILVRLQRSASF